MLTASLKASALFVVINALSYLSSLAVVALMGGTILDWGHVLASDAAFNAGTACLIAGMLFAFGAAALTLDDYSARR